MVNFGMFYTSDLKSFLNKVRKFLILPVCIIIISLIVFFVHDPFKIIYEYDDYSGYNVNLEYVGVENFKKNNNKQKYNSFVLGSSRLAAFREDSWNKYLTSEDQVYFFPAYYETINGIYNKVRYLDAHAVRIDNCLIVIDTDLTFDIVDHDSKGYFVVKHPYLSDNTWIHFYFKHLQAYYTYFFQVKMYRELLGLFDYGEQNGVVRDIDKIFDPLTNEYSYPNLDFYLDSLERNDSLYFNMSKFPVISHVDTIKSVKITSEYKRMLEEIKEIFVKNNTEYYFVISPLYQQKSFNEIDSRVLLDLFGDRLYDFSGGNSITREKRNYYEPFHYRPHIGDSILNFIYR